MASEEWLPLPATAAPLREIAPESDDPRLDALIGETLCVVGLEWIGELAKPKGVRLYVHRVEGDRMAKSWFRVRGYTESVLRFARDMANGSTERNVRLSRQPIVKVVRQGAHYGLESA